MGEGHTGQDLVPRSPSGIMIRVWAGWREPTPVTPPPEKEQTMRAEFYRPEMNGYWPIRELHDYTTDSRALEQIFEAFNIGTCDDDPELAEAAADYRRTAPYARSLSVGDTVVLVRDLMVGEPPLRLAYRCEGVGWVRVLDPTPTHRANVHFPI
jgi:hypothetical protein